MAVQISSGMDGNPLQFVDTNSWVWYKHEELAWAACKVTKGGREVELENGETRERYTAPANKCYPMHASSLKPVPNLVELADLNEASVLHNLRARYNSGDVFDGVQCDTQMFTYIGPILIYINPYKSLPIFTPELVRTYYSPRSELDEPLPPHVYQVVNNTYLQMRREGSAQGMVISGESGAGKTEATKICLSFLATVAGSTGPDSPTQLLMDSSPIMESFGNAKTVRNNNSSRFGKYMEIHFKDDGARSVIIGGSIKKYLLEKSRIVWQAAGERNFHILVEIFELPAATKAKYGLTKPEDYFYINQGGSIRAEGWNDKEEIEGVQAAFKRLGIDGQAIFDIVAAVLWMGQVKFVGRGQDTAVQIEDAGAVNRVANLLGLDEKGFANSLTTRKVKAGKDTVTTPLNYDQACQARDGIAKHVYSNLFDHITEAINAGVARVKKGDKTPTSIGVLDIFGFECFAVNSFEQLCINYTNEKLQFHFNSHIFLLEMEIYKKERLDVKQITFRDNQGCLDLIEKKRTGVMAMIEEEIYVPKGSDKSMLEKMHKQNYGYNDFYAKPVLRGGRAGSKTPSLSPQEAFIIKHYAGPVPYKADGFLEKCKDRLPPDSEEMLKSSKNALVQGFFKDALGMDTPRGGGRPATLGGKFKDSMQDLYDMLCATSPHFIKCVKPNSIKKNVFDSNFTLYQLTYLGLLEVIRIRKSGYPVRMPDKEFVSRYRLLEPDPNKWPTSRDICADHGTEGDWQIGTTMVFMRDLMFSDLESKRATCLDQRIRGLQQWMREELMRRAWTVKRKGFVMMQACHRGNIARQRVARLRLEVQVERECEEGVNSRKLSLLESAIASAARINHTFPLLHKANAILDRLKDEEEVEDMLTYAIAARDPDELDRALKSADALGLETLWYSLPGDDPRQSLIPRSRLLIEQLSRYGELMTGLAAAMRERTVDALQAMIVECESVELECGELNEARSMLKMAEFEQTTRQVRQDKRQSQIEKQWAKKEEPPPPPPSAVLQQDVVANERRERDFQHALSVAKEHGEAFPGEIERLEVKIHDCQQKLKMASMKEDERLQRLERERAELELAKRSSARNAEVSVLMAAMVPGIRMAMGTYRSQNIETIATKVSARLGSEAEKSEELSSAQDVLAEMKIANKHATEAETLPQLKLALETGKSLHKPHMAKVKALCVALGMALESGVHGSLVTEVKQVAEMVLDAWAVTSMLNHATRLGRRTMLASTLQRAHENAGFQKYAGSEGREAMKMALQRVKTDGIDVSSVPAAQPRAELAVRTQGGQVVIHFLNGRSESFPNRTRLSDAVTQIAAKLQLTRASDYGIYQTTRAGSGERLLSCGDGADLTLGQVCQNWIAQATRYAEMMGTKNAGDADAMGDSKFNYRLFFLRKLVFGDSLSLATPGDVEQLYWHSRKRVESGTYSCNEDDVLTLASLRMQVEFGDHDPVETPAKLKPVLKDFVPNSSKNSQTPKEWLEDLCTTHSRMVGFPQQACKENYIRMTMGYDNFGFTVFKLRQCADPDKPHVNEKVVVGVNYRGLSFFDERNQPYLSYPFLEIDDVEADKTRLQVSLNNGEHLWFQGSVAATDEIVALIADYRATMPRKKKRGGKLRTVAVAGAEDEVDEVDEVDESDAAVASGSTAPPPPPSAPKLAPKPAFSAKGGLFDDDDDTPPPPKLNAPGPPKAPGPPAPPGPPKAPGAPPAPPGPPKAPGAPPAPPKAPGAPPAPPGPPKAPGAPPAPPGPPKAPGAPPAPPGPPKAPGAPPPPPGPPKAPGAPPPPPGPPKAPGGGLFD